ncbi:MAG: type II toxin-antitoxin system prevent-host-death family antitoxin [Mobiluncus porci]|uniref:Antitoxin n=1 Tax=Mobiluncus porci TaxID=2652278 RepID=A0A7K0K3S0_9ACTO|nr:MULTISPECIES: type II toxin-antitoxin system prevent-host-death family antitoxin [Mobiluncus]MCI6583978.1 type II toxin-antitoxin system prevent-host-death family antitoxin [Mobiluncus sp.]MDD7542496.1 type II toxin-antitoxin system prevent-host-death family antitoxin [Mobiluncus porci]MDY5748793.1 type II toxin-antitoxin system prevent-host-death family antitoxin [Mobiluncus porci]MST50068.1 type II toxin-antitoxin system prevent-host-death family antitoxin [Mobiluncus porci]
MIQMNMQEAKTNLSKLVAAAVAGEEVIIARDGKPTVSLTSLVKPPKKEPIKFGGVEGWVADDFDDPLPEEELALWE